MVAEREDEDKKKKNIALRAFKLKSDEENDFEDEEITMMTRNSGSFSRNPESKENSKTSRTKRRRKK